MKHIEKLSVLFAGEPVGILAWEDRQYWFQYEGSWLQQGFDLAPQFLNFNNEPQIARQPTFQGLHGVFYDSLPDGWGMLLMDRFFKKEFAWDTHEMTPFDRLAYMGKRAMGALEYEPVITNDTIDEKINLASVVENAEKIVTGNSHTVLSQLRILGGSPGGARPKITLALANHSDECLAGLKELPEGYHHYLVKFRGSNDPSDMGRIEKAYSELALKAGVDVPVSRLIPVMLHQEKNELFAVQRFDRDKNTKKHLLTLGGYLYADYRMPSVDYHALLAATAVLTKDIREVKRAFRLMIFNVATHNKDDHVKNFSFLCDRSGKWRLSPAYDLTFSQGYNNEHTTSINGAGNPTRKDFALLAEAHDINEWEETMDDVLNAVSLWREIARRLKVTKFSIERIAKPLDEIRKRLAK